MSLLTQCTCSVEGFPSLLCLGMLSAGVSLICIQCKHNIKPSFIGRKYSSSKNCISAPKNCISATKNCISAMKNCLSAYLWWNLWLNYDSYCTQTQKQTRRGNQLPEIRSDSTVAKSKSVSPWNIRSRKLILKATLVVLTHRGTHLRSRSWLNPCTDEKGHSQRIYCRQS